MLTYVSELKIHSIYVEFAFYKPPIINAWTKKIDNLFLFSHLTGGVKWGEGIAVLKVGSVMTDKSFHLC